MRVRVLLACTRWGDTVMTRRTIELLVTLILAILMAPLAAEMPPAGKVYRIG